MPGIPDRWEAYTPLGKPVGNTNFIPFKVPLKLTLCKHLPEAKKFTPCHLLNMVGKLGLVIDLTNTRRYYNPEELTSSGVRYVKIFCQGRGKVPNAEIVSKFYDAVQDFLNEKKDGLIGVHCTHGLNRTGYLICRYMIENLGYSAEDAIKEFNKARGHEIERPEYLRDLYKIEEKNMDTEMCEKVEDRGRMRNNYTMKYRRERYYDPARNMPSNSRPVGYGKTYEGRSYQQNSSVHYHVPNVDHQDRNTEIKTGRKNNRWQNHRSHYIFHNPTAAYLPLMDSPTAYFPMRYTYSFQAQYGNWDHRNRSNSFAEVSQQHCASSHPELD